MQMQLSPINRRPLAALAVPALALPAAETAHEPPSATAATAPKAGDSRADAEEALGRGMEAERKRHEGVMKSISDRAKAQDKRATDARLADEQRDRINADAIRAQRERDRINADAIKAQRERD